MLKVSLPTLVDINIRYNIHYNIEETDDSPLADLCCELEKMIGKNVVETITIGLWIWSGCDCTRWGKLDDVLMGSPEGWPALREVSLSFLCHSMPSARDFSDTVLQEFPMTKLLESDRVQFNFDIINL
jgi:hypothetical protein